MRAMEYVPRHHAEVDLHGGLEGMIGQQADQSILFSRSYACYVWSTCRICSICHLYHI